MGHVFGGPEFDSSRSTDENLLIRVLIPIESVINLKFKHYKQPLKGESVPILLKNLGRRITLIS